MSRNGNAPLPETGASADTLWRRAPEAVAVDIRLAQDGLLAVNRLLMTFLNKRMPVADITLARSGSGELRATVLLECDAESARRYATLLSTLEDVAAAELAADSELAEVALVRAPGESEYRTLSGSPEEVERRLAEGSERGAQSGQSGAEVVRLGPVVVPGSNRR